MRMRGRTVLGTVLVGAAVAVAGPVSPAVAAAPSCPAAFDLLTYEQAFALPQTQLAFDRGLITRAALLPVYQGLDVNGNGVFCVRAPLGWSQTAVEDKDALLKFKDDTTT
jgi:hypothetical protein